jgi:integrase
MRAKLTKRIVDATSNAARDVFVWDSELRGLGLKVTPKNRRVFVVQYWSPKVRGARRRITLGTYGAITVDQARSAALEILSLVARGGDPVTDSDNQGAKAIQATVDALSREYLDENRGKLKTRTRDEYERLFKVYILPTFGSVSVAAITSKNVAALHQAHAESPYQANRILQLLRAFLYWAELRGHRAAGPNPCKSVTKFPEHSSERFLTVEELSRLGRALTEAADIGLRPAPMHRKRAQSFLTQKHRPKSADIPIVANPFAVAVIRFLLLSGWREQEALTLPRAAVDFDRGFATLEDSKTGRSHRPLGGAALQLLKELPRINSSPYFFPGAKPNQPLREIRRLWYAARHAAGLDDVRLHDLRHTVASFSVANGNSLFLTGKLLGHARAETTQRYAHLTDDARRVAADGVASSIAEAMSK